MPCAILVEPVKLTRFAVNFVLMVALGAIALATSVALLAPASGSLAGAVSMRSVDVTLKAEPQRSYVFDRNGNVMTTLYDEDRAPVKLKDVPKVVIDAVLAIEDRKFYEHNGVDYAGAFRAFFKNADSGAIEQGGSTITEQLIKNTLHKDVKDRTVKVKVSEMVLATRLENELSKSQILEDYLNLVPFGHNAFGIEVAAERYFNETMYQLTLPQAALLAGLVQAPSRLDPISSPANAFRRRRIVLSVMRETNKITAAQADAANAAPLPTKLYYPEASQRSYYIDAVLDQLLKPNAHQPLSAANVLGKTPKEAHKHLYEGGLRIYTNYDPTTQYMANLAISDIVPKNQSQFTAALVSIDNKDGAVRALAFGRGYDSSQFDPALDGPGRQAGSSFKSITLAAALSSGYSPDDRVPGYSLRWRLGPGEGTDSFYRLSGDCHGGEPTLTQAIAISDNCAFVRTELSLGPGHYGQDGARRVISMASRMGIDTSHFSPVVSTTLGTNGVHPFEMAQAYTVIAADGILHPATFVAKIVGPTGKVLYETPTNGKRILEPEVARSETQMLTQVLKNGTAGGLSIGRPAAGKTGTTDHNQDAWFIGYTPEITTAVWMGDPTAETPMTNVGGRSVFGATYPAEIWAAYMKSALGNSPPTDFIAPNEKLWPERQRIDEMGRGFRSYRQPDFTTTTTSPVVITPETKPTIPFIVRPTTPPPVTVPHTTPRTTPPPTAPPPTAPPPTTGP